MNKRRKLIQQIHARLAALSEQVERKAIAVLLGFVVLGVCAWLGVSQISFVGSKGVFDPADPGEQRYRQLNQFFDASGEVVVLADTGEDHALEARAQQAMQALGESLNDEPRIAEAVWGFNRHDVGPKLLLTQPLDTVRAEAQQITKLRPLLISQTPAELLRNGAAQSMQSVESGGAANQTDELAEGAQVFNALMQVFNHRLNTPHDEPIDMFTAMEASLGDPPWQWLTTSSGRLLVMRVGLREAVDETNGYQRSLSVLRDHLDAVRSRFSDVEMGLTGFEPVRLEAESAIRPAVIRALAGGAAGLLLLCGLAWRSVRLPGVVGAVVLTSCWLTLGVSGLVVGELGVLSLVGLGVTVVMAAQGGVMLCAAFARCGSAARAFDVTFGVVGVISCVAVLSGLFVWCWSDVPGVREAASVVVTGSGCVAITVLFFGTASLAVLSRWSAGGAWRCEKTVANREDAAGLLADWAGRQPRAAWGLAVIMAGTMVAASLRAHTTLDLSSYLPADSEGARWQKIALTDGGEMGFSAAFVVDSLEDAADLTAQLRPLPEVSKVSGIARLVPDEMESKQAVLRELDLALGADARALLADQRDAESGRTVADAATTPRDDLLAQIKTTNVALSFMGKQVADPQHQAWLGEMGRASQQVLETAGRLTDDQRRQRLNALQDEYTACRKRVGQIISDLLEARPIDLSDVRQAHAVFSPWIAERIRDNLGSSATDESATPVLLVKAYPSAEANSWPTAADLHGFFAAIRDVDEQVTGDLERIFYRSTSLVIQMRWAGVGLVGALVIVLLTTGRHLFCVLISVGVLAVFGVSFVAVSAALGQGITVVSWVLWPVPAALVCGWVVALTSDRWAERDQARADVEGRRIQRAAGGEAFGLSLAAGFVVAAGLRSAAAPGITATAVGFCVSVGLVGLIGLLVLRPRRSR